MVLVLFFYFPRPVSWYSSVAQTDPEFAIYLLQPPDCAPPDFVCVWGGGMNMAHTITPCNLGILTMGFITLSHLPPSCVGKPNRSHWNYNQGPLLERKG